MVLGHSDFSVNSALRSNSRRKGRAANLEREMSASAGAGAENPVAWRAAVLQAIKKNDAGAAPHLSPFIPDTRYTRAALLLQTHDILLRATLPAAALEQQLS